MALLSTQMSSSGRLRSRSTWVYAENKSLKVLGVPLVPPQCGIWARRHHAEMAFMNELWFAVVPPPSAPTSFLMLLSKASTNSFDTTKTKYYPTLIPLRRKSSIPDIELGRSCCPTAHLVRIKVKVRFYSRGHMEHMDERATGPSCPARGVVGCKRCSSSVSCVG